MADDGKTDDLLPQWDWAIASSDDLVRYAGLMGVRDGPGYLIQPAPEGFQAQAEIIRRLMVATEQLTAEMGSSGATMKALTVWLVVLTVVLVVLGIAAIVVTAQSG